MGPFGSGKTNGSNQFANGLDGLDNVQMFESSTNVIGKSTTSGKYPEERYPYNTVNQL